MAAKKTQLLPKTEFKSGWTRSHLKEARAFIARKPIHVVLRSRHAKGKLSMLTPANKAHLKRILNYCKFRFNVKLLDFANGGNHLQLKIQANNREDLRNFMRTTTALISRAVTGASRGKPFLDGKGLKTKFWDASAFSRVLNTAYDEKILQAYFAGKSIEEVYGTEAQVNFFAETRVPVPKLLKV